ncbi:hypothetical protein [Flavobacterium sp. '19STA2R22 D10 B1']|uniref:hypothetical protein n=1 Tax=Flavobacterium aerium TaxID=3037261 RepID=UPI00278C74C9|nr:hypothetical protein [Flavobacterium sp. '19STA2R22 D10 B1']
MANINPRAKDVVAFTKIIAYFSLFYAVVLFCQIIVNVYRYFTNDNPMISPQFYLKSNYTYYVLLAGAILLCGLNFYAIKKEKCNWILVVFSIAAIGIVRFNFELIHTYFSQL